MSALLTLRPGESTGLIRRFVVVWAYVECRRRQGGNHDFPVSAERLRGPGWVSSPIPVGFYDCCNWPGDI